MSHYTPFLDFLKEMLSHSINALPQPTCFPRFTYYESLLILLILFILQVVILIIHLILPKLIFYFLFLIIFI